MACLQLGDPHCVQAPHGCCGFEYQLDRKLNRIEMNTTFSGVDYVRQDHIRASKERND